MRSVVRLRTRPGRPWWQLTTRPSTAAVLALVSLAAAGVQVALFSSPTPWYQIAVVAFWSVVGVAFVASALGTRSRTRRQAAAAAARPPVDAVPFVPVPVRPARPRRREEPDAGPSRPVAPIAPSPDAELGEPTEPVGTTTSVVRPSPAPRPSPVAAKAGGVAEDRTTTVPRPGPARRPAPVADPSRRAARAVTSAESASRPAPVPAERREALTAETIALRDGRVRPRPGAGAETSVTSVTSVTERPTGGGRRRLADASRGGPAPDGAVPSPRPVPREERPQPTADRATASPRPTPARRTPTAPDPDGTPRRSAHAKRTAAEVREETPASGRSKNTDARPAAAQPARERHVAQDSVPRKVRDVPVAGSSRTRRREEPPAASTETTVPFGGGMTFGGVALPADPAPESWAPAPRRPVPEPATGRHAALTASPAEGVPRSPAARHAVAAEPGRRRAS